VAIRIVRTTRGRIGILLQTRLVLHLLLRGPITLVITVAVKVVTSY